MYSFMTQHPMDQLAVVASTRRLTWRALLDESLRLASALARQPAVHHIGLYAQNGPDAIIAIHAVHLAGKVLVPLNTRLTMQELETQCQTAQLDLLLCDADIPLPIPQLALSARDDDPITPTAWGRDDVMSLMFTSGTTGRAKAVQQTYGNHIASVEAASQHLGYDASDRVLIVTPLFHMSGLAQVYRSARLGATLYIEAKFDVTRTLDLLKTEQITHLSLVSIMLQRLLDEGLTRHSLRTILVGGGPVPKPLLEETERRGLPVAQTYGMTETCAQVATLLPEEALRHIGSSGRAIPPTRIRISSDGEIEVKGPSVTPGYYKQHEADSWTSDGYWRTGDLGTLVDGYLYVHDRRSDLIISGGENIYPAEIEAVLLRCPGVCEAGVVGQADLDWGSVPVAFIVGSFNRDEMTALLDTYLARYKHPKAWFSLEELPRNANGKLMRHRLKERLHD